MMTHIYIYSIFCQRIHGYGVRIAIFFIILSNPPEQFKCQERFREISWSLHIQSYVNFHSQLRSSRVLMFKRKFDRQPPENYMDMEDV